MVYHTEILILWSLMYGLLVFLIRKAINQCPHPNPSTNTTNKKYRRFLFSLTPEEFQGGYTVIIVITVITIL